jgi:hypothetical protein
MSLIFMDGFDFYTTSQVTLNGFSGTPAFFSNSYGGVSPRFGYGYFCNPNGNGNNGMNRALPTKTSIVFGVAIYWFGNNPNRAVLQFYDPTGLQVALKSNGGYLQFYRGGQQLAASSAPYRLGWNYYELAITIDQNNGSLELRINGSTFMKVENVNTQGSATNTLTFMDFGASSAWDFLIDDVYMVDTLGTTNNTFLGDVRVVCQVASGPGDSAQWTPNGASANWQCTNSIPFAGSPSSFVSSSTPGQVDLYAVGAPPSAVNTVFALQTNLVAYKDDSGTRTIHGLLKSGSTLVETSDYALGTSYQPFITTYDNDPNTSAPWTSAALSQLQIGIKEIA